MELFAAARTPDVQAARSRSRWVSTLIIQGRGSLADLGIVNVLSAENSL